ncbi:HalOD1 output domain-containing protein [Halorarum salinum]|uniref:Halobacterial output domain-containing protein n=1 Tax=Halorarum salinum TaxID=2743089 RepID=A0A7D5LET2_9EURY|nr:HalOD1 output domain-containing protein [Halobaculum salinum]QLG64309.1 hypothetical protein HUG12_21250 [Halobaculum salinum]
MTAADPTYVDSDQGRTGARGHSRVRGDDESVAEAVVRTVSEATGVEPTSVEPLNSVVDADALNALFRPRLNGEKRTGGGVFFLLDGCEVTVHGDGEVVVRPEARSSSA